MAGVLKRGRAAQSKARSTRAGRASTLNRRNQAGAAGSRARGPGLIRGANRTSFANPRQRALAGLNTTIRRGSSIPVRRRTR